MFPSAYQSFRPAPAPLPMAHDDPRKFRSIFVGDLSFFCTEVELASTFSKFGNITSLEIKRGRHGDSLLHGFVEFESPHSCELAIDAMNGKVFMGRVCRVNWSNLHPGPNMEAASWIQVHVNFTAADVTCRVDEEFLGHLFTPFGRIGDIAIKRHGCTGQPLHAAGYGFVYFVDIHAALNAVHAMRGVMINGVRLDSMLSHKAESVISQALGGIPTTGNRKVSRPQQSLPPRNPQHAQYHMPFAGQAASSQTIFRSSPPQQPQQAPMSHARQTSPPSLLQPQSLMSRHATHGNPSSHSQPNFASKGFGQDASFAHSHWPQQHYSDAETVAFDGLSASESDSLFSNLYFDENRRLSPSSPSIHRSNDGERTVSTCSELTNDFAFYDNHNSAKSVKSQMSRYFLDEAVSPMSTSSYRSIDPFAVGSLTLDKPYGIF